MRLMVGRRRAISGVFFLFSLLAISMSSYAEVKIPTKPERPREGQVANLMEPVKDVLSGRSWLILEGIDPGLRARPGWNPLTRLDWRALEEIFVAPSSSTIGNPALQAPAAAFLVPFRHPAPAFSRDVLITRDFSQIPFQTEPHLAVHPNDSDHIVVGLIDYNFPTVSSYVSMDGGITWEGPFQVPYLPDDRVSGGDPVLAFDREGKVYFASISMGVKEFTVGPLYFRDTVSSIVVARSEDGGFSWPQTVSTARSTVGMKEQRIDAEGKLRGILSVSFLDKPWMSVGPHPDFPEKDVIYVTYTDFEVDYRIQWVDELPALMPRAIQTTIRLVSSKDGGCTWSDPVAVSPTVQRLFGEIDQPVDIPGVFGTDRVVQGSQPVVDKDGNLYVAWLDSTDDGSMKGLAEIHVARSADGGKTFSRAVIASLFNEIPFRPRTAFFRYWGAAFPQMAIGPEGGLYIVYTARPPDRRGDDGDIYFISSLDSGKSWSRPVRLNDDRSQSLQFFPAVDVDPKGIIHVMWGDMRDDPSQTKYHIYYTRSYDKGKSWGFEIEELGLKVRDTRVTDFPSNPNRGFPYGLFIGDYFAIQATEEDVYMVWADTRLGEFGPMNQKIAFARQRSIRSPDIFISPPAGAGGQNIAVQGFNFQPNMNVFIQLGDATIASARTNDVGRFTTSLYIPVTGEGPQTLSVLDESGNRASTSFYTEFGFDNLQELRRDLMEEMGTLRDTLKALESLLSDLKGKN
ncbi:exo-alpha-sialidase [Candidatus Aerophobetes bacterium]|nr:exo-alpha-sialidase [Candidatus Aerophobetes bacterium]